MNADDMLPDNWLETAVREAKAEVEQWPSWKKAAMRVTDSYDRPERHGLEFVNKRKTQ